MNNMNKVQRYMCRIMPLSYLVSKNEKIFVRHLFKTEVLKARLQYFMLIICMYLCEQVS